MTGNDVRKQIRALDLTQVAFAGVTGWHPVSISRLVRYGEKSIPVASARRIKESIKLAKQVG